MYVTRGYPIDPDLVRAFRNRRRRPWRTRRPGSGLTLLLILASETALLAALCYAAAKALA